MKIDMGLVDLIDFAAEQDRDNKEAISIFPLRPSAAGKCSRALYYDLQVYLGKMNIEVTKNSPETMRILDLGHFIEDSLIGHFKLLAKQMGIEVKYRQQVVDIITMQDGTIFSGSTDFALEGPNDFKILCDVKSSKDAFSAYYKTRWDENVAKWESFASLSKLSPTCFVAENALELVKEFGDDFKIDNITQLNLYLGSDFFKKRGYEYASLLYYIKNDSRVYELRFRFNQELFDKTCEKLTKIYNAKNIKSISKDFSFGSIRCAFCQYNKECWKGDSLMEYFSTFPTKEKAENINFIKDESLKTELESLFTDYETKMIIKLNVESLEKSILNTLTKNNIGKIRLQNGNIYEVKQLKTPKPHSELRRSK